MQTSWFLLTAAAIVPLVQQNRSERMGRIDLNPDSLGRIFSFFMDYSKTSIRFYLFTNQKNGSEELIIDNPQTLRSSRFSRAKPLKVLIHGYKRNGWSDFPHIVKDAYLETDREVNVVCVDWRRQANEKIYLNSAFKTRMVGERVGEFVGFLRDTQFINSFSDVHLVGFSLGAQVAGYAGKFIQHTRNGKIGRITGLDPAGPAFTGPDPKNRLDSSDASFVDVIHTSIWKSGLWKPIAHVDFFPNGGERQPGCAFENVVDPFLGGCSHIRAVELFAESIRGSELWGQECGSWKDYVGQCNCTGRFAVMGQKTDFSARGNFFLRTNSSPPFMLTLEPTSDPARTKTGRNSCLETEQPVTFFNLLE